MAPVPQVSPVTGKPTPPHYLHSSSVNFQDQHGRSILLRGVNFSGAGKAPHNQPSWSQAGFWEEAEAGRGDFVGRPLNLDDGSADIHLARLKAWGYNCLRYVFTWEAIEHEGPGKYDEAFMDYVIKVLYKCGEWGFRVYMDPHQDVWSRFTGGSGAPLWTIYACGIDPYNMVPTSGVLLQSEYPSKENAKPKTFPQMIWATNYTHLVSQTIWTLFFAGKTYAPKCIIDGVNIQDYLQSHFIDAVSALAKKVAAAPGLHEEIVIGWDSMNEPGMGMVERKNLAEIPAEQQLKKGPSPTPFEGMRLGMGQAVEVDVWDFGQLGPSKSGRLMIDPKGTRVWLKAEDEQMRGGGKWGWKRGDEWELGTCIWAQHGVWDPTKNQLLKPAYFSTLPSDTSRQVSFTDDFWTEHWKAYGPRMREHHPDAILFVQPPVFAVPPILPEKMLSRRACTTPHYYDGLTLMTKHWNWFNADALGLLRGKYWNVIRAVRIGDTAIRKSVQDQLGILKSDTLDRVGNYPTLIGEIGCPFDMDGKKAYGYVDGGKGEGDYSAQTKAWDCSLNGSDGPNCLNFTLWTYVPDNSHEWGDNWNGEDLSIWSADDCGRLSNLNGESETETEASPAASMTDSSVTLAVPSSPTKGKGTSTYTPEGIESGSGITPTLILDGSRAVGATCRPFPVATVGTPERIDFDIASSTFKLSIKVSSDDSVPEGVTTEIYVPFVHYAESLTSTAKRGSMSTSSSSTDLVQSPQSAPSPSSPPLALSIDVRTSVGSYTTQGQTLRWTYPIPKQFSTTYQIEISRKGGALARDQGWDATGSWGDVCSRCVIA